MKVQNSSEKRKRPGWWKDALSLSFALCVMLYGGFGGLASLAAQKPTAILLVPFLLFALFSLLCGSLYIGLCRTIKSFPRRVIYHSVATAAAFMLLIYLLYLAGLPSTWGTPGGIAVALLLYGLLYAVFFCLFHFGTLLLKKIPWKSTLPAVKNGFALCFAALFLLLLVARILTAVYGTSEIGIHYYQYLSLLFFSLTGAFLFAALARHTALRLLVQYIHFMLLFSVTVLVLDRNNLFRLTGTAQHFAILSLATVCYLLFAGAFLLSRRVKRQKSPDTKKKEETYENLFDTQQRH